MPMTQGGGFIRTIPGADLLAPVTKCECLWGRNECPNAPLMIVVCWQVRGFTVCCDPHLTNFVANVDPGDGSYQYLTLGQFEQAKKHGLYKDYQTWGQYFKAVTLGLKSYQEAIAVGLFPDEADDA